MTIYCESCGKQAFYGNLETDKNGIIKYKRRYCKTHANGAKYLNVKFCIEITCKVIPTLGYICNKPIACLAHSQPDMKNVTTRKCETCNEKQPSFNFEGLPPKYCFDCKFDEEGNIMINTKINHKRKTIDT